MVIKNPNLNFIKEPQGIRSFLLLVIFLWFSINSSFSQFNIYFESARSLPRKSMEFLGSYASSFYTYKGQKDPLLNSLGLNVGIGASNILDFKLVYTRLFGSGYVNTRISTSFNTLSFFPKLSIRKQIFAVAFPFGIHFRSEYLPKWYIAPSLLFTIPYKKVFEATISPNVCIQIGEKDQFWVGCNLGLGISSDLDVWSIRPDVGLKQSAFDKGIFWSLGLSLVYILDFGIKKPISHNTETVYMELIEYKINIHKWY